MTKTTKRVNKSKEEIVNEIKGNDFQERAQQFNTLMEQALKDFGLEIKCVLSYNKEAIIPRIEINDAKKAEAKPSVELA